MPTLQYIAPTARSKMSRARRVKIFLSRNGVCWKCGVQITDGEVWTIEHPEALNLGGSDDDAALWPIHYPRCVNLKNASDAKLIAKRNKSVDRAYVGAAKKGKPMPGSRKSGWRHRMDGRWEKR